MYTWFTPIRGRKAREIKHTHLGEFVGGLFAIESSSTERGTRDWYLADEDQGTSLDDAQGGGAWSERRAGGEEEDVEVPPISLAPSEQGTSRRRC
jgi:hypothetical protein